MSPYDAFEEYITGQESLRVNPESYGNLLIPIVVEKLPKEVRRITTRSHNESFLDLGRHDV